MTLRTKTRLTKSILAKSILAKSILAKTMLAKTMQSIWYPEGKKLYFCASWLLLPLSLLFYWVVQIRLRLFKHHFLKSFTAPVPVIVVGNITVGGTGKTPFVIGLVQLLKEQGYMPGIVSRGAGGKRQAVPMGVNADSDVQIVGDEALLLAKRAKCPLAICADRPQAIQYLCQNYPVNIIISDDGLQHYAMHRDIEIAMIDNQRQFGNGYLLPAGPLREPIKRLAKVSFVIANRQKQNGKIFSKNSLIPADCYDMALTGDRLYSLQTLSPMSDWNTDTRTHLKCVSDLKHSSNNTFQDTLLLSELSHKKIHAVCAIGNPQRFFGYLRDLGMDVVEHIFPDHYQYKLEDIFFDDELDVVMTEKDAMKYIRFAPALKTKKIWYLPVEAQLENNFKNDFLKKLRNVHGITSHIPKTRVC